MASSTPPVPRLSSWSTALVILPPAHIQALINPLRSANDKSFPRWTSHLTFVYPFVEPPALPTACSLIREALAKANIQPFSFKLDKVGNFEQRYYDTVFLGPSQASNVHRLWDVVSSAVGYSGRPFVPHLTLGQTQSRDRSSAFLRRKGELLLEQVVEWDVYSVVILRKSNAEGRMDICEEILLSPDDLPHRESTVAALVPDTYRFGPKKWMPCLPAPSQAKTFTLATYNVLHDARIPTGPRLNALLSTLLALQPVPDLVCLQEVTDESLRLLAADPGIRARWPWCTHDPNSVLPNERNIVCLSQEGFGFTWEYIQLHKHKPAAILHVPRRDADPFIISAVHLAAGLEASQLRAKLDELKVLLQFLKQHHLSSPWIIMGDFNVPTSEPIPPLIMDNFIDVWLTLHGSEYGGATYDPNSNVLAAETVKNNRSPQRYDRIWVRHDAGINMLVIEKFGLGGEASDHYGLTASFSLGVDPKDKPAMEAVHGDSHGVTRFHATISDQELDKTVRHHNGYPTTSQRDERNCVTSTLQAVLSLKVPSRSAVGVNDSQLAATASSSVVRFEFVPVGSFGLGVDTQDSDVDVLVVGNIPPPTFWSLARALLHKSAPKPHDNTGVAEKADPSTVIVKRFVKNARVPVMELMIGNVHVDMQYCSARKLVESWDQIHTLSPTDSVFLLPAPSLRTLNAYRDILAVLRAIPASSLPAFRLAHRIFASRLGYLGGIHLTLLLTRITLLSPPDQSATQLIHAFFATYADWDWAQDAVTIPGVSDSSTYTRAVGQEPMVIMTIEKPVFNVVQNANRHTLNAIVSSFTNANRQLADGLQWAELCGSGGICGKKFQSIFMSSHESYIKVDLILWGSSTAKARAWISYVESRLPYLLVHLQTSLPDWTVRLWPSRLVDANQATGSQSFYLLGISPRIHTPTSTEKVETTLLSFENQLRRNETFYDPTEMFVSLSRVGSSQLPKSITTPPAWPNSGIEPYEDLSNDEDVAELSDYDSDAAFVPISSKQSKKNRPHQLKGRHTPHVPAPKLRTSSDVYYRILWDRELNPEDYLIGYEDRFSGLKEMPLPNWKRDVEHEDFVPFHRVMHFRRKGDGVLIWDRRNKVDLMFGSGVLQSSA
ncbi:hypothetical protein JB92DRAFT_3095335 [Gautieria morchelliformis]|nr:hypothetical protein JB92DRAFT_3095335 [Gautieria morchelliformis]